MEHELKIEPPYFEAVISGKKNFEVRYDDRGFQAGDTVTLREHTNACYTGRTFGAVIGYVTAYKQMPGFVVFSLVTRG